jgi:hypothetical protein
MEIFESGMLEAYRNVTGCFVVVSNSVDVCTFFQKILDNPFVASLSGVIESSYS